jgi:hypothetical protein
MVAQAKKRAFEEGTTMTDILVQGLKARLERSQLACALPVSKAGGGLNPGLRWGKLVAADSGVDDYR